MGKLGEGRKLSNEERAALVQKRLKNATSLDAPEDQDVAEIGADIAAGFTPLGIPQAARDFERSRREGDVAGMALSGLGAIPVLGGMTKVAKNAGKVKKVLDAAADAEKLIPKTTREAVERAVEAPKQVSVDKRFKSGDKAGIYRGTEAFGGVNPQRLGSMRAKYMDKMEKGADGRLWYDESSDYIHKVTGGKNDDADKKAASLAVLSSSTPVDSNLMYSNKGWNQNLVGDKIDTGKYPTAMGKSLRAIHDEEGAAATGLKRSPFSAGLSVNWRGPEFANRPTHDIHDVRAWDIKDPITGGDWKKGVGEAGHRWLDEQADWVTNKANQQNLGGYNDWTPYRGQAAAWIAQKAEKEGKAVGDTAHHYGYFAPEYTGQVTREWPTFEGAPHIPESANASLDARKAYSDDVEQHFRTDQGTDKLAHSMGALSDDTLRNVGFYEGKQNPGFTSQIPVGKKTGSQEIDDASQKVLDAHAANYGLVGVQKQVANNYFGGQSPLSKAGGVKFAHPEGRPMNEEELLALAQRADNTMVDPKGARALVFGDDAADTAAKVKALRSIGNEMGYDVTAHHRSGNLFPSVDEWGTPPESWSSRPYIDAIMKGGDKIVEGSDRFWADNAEPVYQTMKKHIDANNWTEAPWYGLLMDTLKTKGIRGVDELQKQGKIPVVIAGTGAGGGAGISAFNENDYKE